MPFLKPEAHWKVKARQDRQHAKLRKAAVDQKWKDANSSCELCGKWLKRPRETDVIEEMGHVDEIIPKSLGGSDTDPDNLRLLCHSDHFSGPSGAHRKTQRIIKQE
jgi:5-methylcytosine-specific restriction endonuclease McrA